MEIGENSGYQRRASSLNAEHRTTDVLLHQVAVRIRKDIFEQLFLGSTPADIAMSPALGTLDQHEALRIYYLGITEHLRVCQQPARKYVIF